MERPNEIHLTLDYLQEMVDTARRLNIENPNSTCDMVRITKTASRQSLNEMDKVEMELLGTEDNHEILEG